MQAVLSVTRRGRRSGGLFGFSLGRFLGGPSGLFGGLGALGGDRGHHARAEDDGGAVRVAAVTLSPNQKKLMMTENGIAEKPRHEERSMLP